MAHQNRVPVAQLSYTLHFRRFGLLQPQFAVYWGFGGLGGVREISRPPGARNGPKTLKKWMSPVLGAVLGNFPGLGGGPEGSSAPPGAGVWAVTRRHQGVFGPGGAHRNRVRVVQIFRSQHSGPCLSFSPRKSRCAGVRRSGSGFVGCGPVLSVREPTDKNILTRKNIKRNF